MAMGQQYDWLAELLDLPNVRVIHFQLVGSQRLNVVVESISEAALCPRCQQPSLIVHDQGEAQMIRDLPIWNRRCWLSYRPRRFDCVTCDHTFVERVAWREPGLDYTVRYEHALYEKVRRESVAQVAQDERLSEDIVQGIFERWAKKRSPNAAILV
jgi:transposase